MFDEIDYWHSRKILTEPYIIAIHDNVSIATNVTFITHDVMASMLSRIAEYKEDNSLNFIPWMDKIEILNNVVIGANSTIMYGVKIEPNAIVAVGSIVTKDIIQGEIWRRCPARKIGDVDSLV